MDSLDLYAKIEPLIGFYEEYERLYEEYLKILEEFDCKKVLEIGFGRGRFLELLKKRGYEALGIERSEEMLKRASKKDLNVKKKDLKDLKDSFDCAVAIGDVLNYMDEKTLRGFFKDLKRVLKKGGVFIADINTEFGFEEITQGVMLKDNEDAFLAIEAEFENKKLITDIFFFQKEGELYKKEKARIVQYYYPFEKIVKLSGLDPIDLREFRLFADEADKEILILKNV